MKTTNKPKKQPQKQRAATVDSDSSSPSDPDDELDEADDGESTNEDNPDGEEDLDVDMNDQEVWKLLDDEV